MVGVADWVTKFKADQAAAEERAKAEEQARLQALADVACPKFRALVEPVLPEGVKVVRVFWRAGEDSWQRTRVPVPCLALDLGNGIEVWMVEQGGRIQLEYEYHGIGVVQAPWTRAGVGAALVHAYEEAVGLKRRMAEEQERRERAARAEEAYRARIAAENERREREAQLVERLKPLGERAARSIHDLAHEVARVQDWSDSPCRGEACALATWGALSVSEPDPWAFVQADDPVARYEEALAVAVAEAREKAAALFKQKKAEEGLAAQARELETMKAEVTLYRLRFPTAFPGVNDLGAEYQTEYAVAPSPDADGWWTVVRGDELKKLKVLNVHGALTVEEFVVRCDTRATALPEQLRAWRMLEQDGARVQFQRPSVKIVCGLEREDEETHDELP